MIHYPTLLPLPAPKLLGYTPETVLAEKLEAIVKLGLINTRMKDFYDIWIICQSHKLNSKTLKLAIEKVFSNRNTKLEYPVAFSRTFYGAPATLQRWHNFLSTMGKDDPPFQEVIRKISDFVGPLLTYFSLNQKNAIIPSAMQQINPTVPSSSSSIMTPVRWGFRQWENLTAAPASNYYCSLFKIGVGIALCGLVALVYNIYQSKGKGSDGPAATPLFAEPTIESGKRPQTYEAQEIFKLIEKHKQKCIEKGASTFKEALYLLRKPGNPKSSNEIDTFVNQEPTKLHSIRN